MGSQATVFGAVLQFRNFTTQAQHELVVREKLGMVFLPSQLRKFETARLVLRRWDKLEDLDAHQVRPFAYKLSERGVFKRLSL